MERHEAWRSVQDMHLSCDPATMSHTGPHQNPRSHRGGRLEQTMPRLTPRGKPQGPEPRPTCSFVLGGSVMLSSQALDGGCEPGYHVLAAFLEAEFPHHLLKALVLGSGG